MSHVISRGEQVVLYRSLANFCFSLTQHGRETQARQLLLLAPLLHPPAATWYFLALRLRLGASHLRDLDAPGLPA